MKRDTERKITVEDLLRLKRAERPPAEFWATFESEIRAKQLSAIVGKRPWWDGISRVFAASNRYALPVAAAAAFALGWAGIRYAGSHSGISAAPRSGTAVAGAVATVAQPSAPAVEHAAPAPEGAGFVAREPAKNPVVEATESHITQAPAPIATDSVSQSPFVDGIAVTLADYREATREYAQRAVFGTDSEFEPSAAPARQPQADPLAGMDPAAERRARILSPALPAYSTGSPRTAAGDWMKQRASANERMYESMDQVSNDRMLVGFRF
jgi:hypothetical protein